MRPAGSNRIPQSPHETSESRKSESVLLNNRIGFGGTSVERDCKPLPHQVFPACLHFCGSEPSLQVGLQMFPRYLSFLNYSSLDFCLQCTRLRRFFLGSFSASRICASKRISTTGIITKCQRQDLPSNPFWRGM